MFANATVSSRSSSSRSGSCGRNSSMPSLRMQSPLAPRTSINPLFRHSDAPFTSFDASHFQFRQQKIADRRKHLRRYHSHESQSNYIESSGGDSSSKDPTPDNTHRSTDSSNYSKSSFNKTPLKSLKPESIITNNSNVNDNNPSRESHEVREFLDRYSLPRVVRVQTGSNKEPLLLYRCFDNFTKVQAKPVGKKGKEKHDGKVLQFPEGYPGWFSLTSEKGDRTALLHTSLLHLVREQVCSFLSVTSFTAYTAHSPEMPPVTDGLVAPRNSTQYVRTVVRGGQVFRLRAVFQHRDRVDNGGRHSTRSGRLGSKTRDKDLANRYAQLIDVNNQELYAPLTTKGEFYEVHSSTKARLCFPGMLDKTGPLALDKDCLYRLAHLLRRVHLPLKVKLMAGPLPHGLPKDFPDTFILEEKFQEPLLVTCTLPAPGDNIGHQISCLNINSKLKLCRSMLGFDSEYKLFKSQRLQSALSHCHKNVEQWYRQVRLVPNIQNEQKVLLSKEGENSNGDICPGCRKLKKVCNGKCDKYEPQEEDIRRYTETNVEKQIITKEVLEKFPKSKKWYRHFKILGNSDTSSDKFEPTNLDGCEKVKSIERYKDMSKLIEEKFGKKHYNPVKKSASFMFSTKRIDLEETKTRGDPSLLKCQSLDAQLCLADASKPLPRSTRKRGSDVSESFSHEFQMCILENEKGVIDNTKHQAHSLRDLRSLNMVITEIDLDQIKPEPEIITSKPDLIPAQSEHSFITERLCSEFHVKTKIQKKNPKLNIKPTIIETPKPSGTNKCDQSQIHVVEVHQVVNKVQNRALPVVDDLPYSHVIDEVRIPTTTTTTRNLSETENVYAEICDAKSRCTCTNGIERCVCTKRTTNSEYCYVKLGSNGDSITQSSDDDLEAIYNTLR